MLPSIELSTGIFEATIAGIFIIPAKIAVCERADPPAVTKARIFFLSRAIVSLGVRSSATIITFSRSFCPSGILPFKFDITLCDISVTSALLPRIYSLSIFKNLSLNSCPVLLTAYSAIIFSSSIILSTFSI